MKEIKDKFIYLDNQLSGLLEIQRNTGQHFENFFLFFSKKIGLDIPCKWILSYFVPVCKGSFMTFTNTMICLLFLK